MAANVDKMPFRRTKTSKVLLVLYVLLMTRIDGCEGSDSPETSSGVDGSLFVDSGVNQLWLRESLIDW